MRTIVARDVMTPTILTVDEGTSLSELATFLVDREISGAVVTSDDGTPVGVVTLTDLAAAAAQAGDSLGSRSDRRSFYALGWEDTFDASDLRGIRVADGDVTVAEIMTPELIGVEAEAPVSEAAALMCDSHLHRLLVREDDEYVGIITTSDLLGLLVDERAS